MSEQLRSTVGQVRQGAETIALASSDIARGNLELSSRTEEQASTRQETAATMEQITAPVRQNADNAQQIHQLAQDASRLARRGGDVMGNVESTMGGIHTACRNIVDIISVIDGRLQRHPALHCPLRPDTEHGALGLRAAKLARQPPTLHVTAPSSRLNAVTPDPSSCPLCGQSNQCAIEAGLGIEACWCTSTPIEPTALQAVPETSRGRACLCPACAARVHPPWVEGPAKANPSGR